jgi:hypothetical protein
MQRKCMGYDEHNIKKRERNKNLEARYRYYYYYYSSICCYKLVLFVGKDVQNALKIFPRVQSLHIKYTKSLKVAVQGPDFCGPFLMHLGS